MSLTAATATHLLSELQSGNVTAVELTRACLAQIEQHDGDVGAFLRVDSQRALAQAEAIDQRRRRQDRLGPLAGLPVAVKDVLCTQGEPTTCASRMLEHFVPPYDATVVARLKAADAILIGKTNCDEFAMGGSTENSSFRVTRNPWDHERTPGGSSGGSAACLAARMVPLSIGTDTGGSIRQPAAFCGVTGLKPTYGRVSRYGLIAFASSLDQAGPLARSVEDAALLLQVIAGHDPRDATSAPTPVPPYRELLSQSVRGLRIGVVREHFGEGLDSEIEAAVREAVKVFQSQGAHMRDISLPHSRYGVATYYIIAPSEASSNLARYDGVHYGYRSDEVTFLSELDAERAELAAAAGEEAIAALDTPLVRMYRRTRAEGFGPEVKRRIMLGTYALSAGYYEAYYLKALKVRRLVRDDYDAAFRDVDVLLGPVTPNPPFRLGQFTDDPLAMYLGDLCTVGANLAGIPGISIPCGVTRAGLPIGLQLQGPPLQEERLLRAAFAFEAATDWHMRSPEPLEA